MSEDDGTRVEAQSRGYTLRSGRRIEYVSPLVSRFSRSPAHDDVNDKGKKVGKKVRGRVNNKVIKKESM